MILASDTSGFAARQWPCEFGPRQCAGITKPTVGEFYQAMAFSKMKANIAGGKMAENSDFPKLARAMQRCLRRQNCSPAPMKGNTMFGLSAKFEQLASVVSAFAISAAFLAFAIVPAENASAVAGMVA
ncbi:hypothetical protein QQS45_01925 [Alteriqipengyuania flavescens]|uniref:hypothetical protein n=1 Tax=Alteriqipengyuania flavescens TaxID=3053610 RepID=UPI0025B325CE|nr:hypothetical protein [Alteriqipengyuania flavescens]WJY19021.1 hypothetical protein QQW98_01920 [Alteriqipengyuania flavescens]WJY24962.1 hypothetical protein QQS45_01925 [Alteriqipengyuania flavescens]